LAGLAEPWGAMWRAFEALDIAAAGELVHPELVWETRWPGMDGAYQGLEGLRRYLANLEQAIAPAPPELIEARELGGERLLLHYRVSGRGAGSGAPVAMEFYDIWTMRDELLIRRQVFYDRQEALAAAGGG
jgi:ketosteroid isomerase-like protein